MKTFYALCFIVIGYSVLNAADIEKGSGRGKGSEEIHHRKQRRKGAADAKKGSECAHPFHDHVVNMCQQYDINSPDLNGHFPVESVLRDHSATREYKQSLIRCLYFCNRVPIKGPDRFLARALCLTCIMPGK